MHYIAAYNLNKGGCNGCTFHFWSGIGGFFLLVVF